MKKIIAFILIAISILSFGKPAIASSDVRDYFILDKGYDIGKIKPGNGWFYTPVVSYKDGNGVKNLFQDNYWYAKDFYEDHGFKEEFIDGKNSSSYFYVDWNKDIVLDNIQTVRKLTHNLVYSYRKDGKIRWQSGGTMPKNFVAGYERAGNDLVILYPIIDKEQGKTAAFIQYPCGNLVCKDSSCSALKKKKKSLSCDISVTAKKIFNTDDVALNFIKNDPKVEFESLYVNGNKTISKVTSNSLTMRKPNPGKYHLKLTAKDQYNGAHLECETNIEVHKAPFCGDSKKDVGEQCDDGNKRNGDGCSSTCELEKPSCDLKAKSVCLDPGSSIYDAFDISASNGVFSSVKINGTKKDKYYKFNKGGVQKLALTFTNPISNSVKYTCEASVKVRSNPFCGDGIVNNGEKCDPNDSITGPMCTSSCQAKSLNTCGIEVTGDFIKNKNIFIGVDKDYYAVIEHVEIDGKKVKSYGDYSAYKPARGGSHNIKVVLKNKIDPSRTRTCTQDIFVEETDLCR